nr:MAG TPA: hypothetical protein [Caudoviricetes sp.]
MHRKPYHLLYFSKHYLFLENKNFHFRFLF